MSILFFDNEDQSYPGLNYILSLINVIEILIILLSSLFVGFLTNGLFMGVILALAYGVVGSYLVNKQIIIFNHYREVYSSYKESSRINVYDATTCANAHVQLQKMGASTCESCGKNFNILT